MSNRCKNKKNSFQLCNNYILYHIEIEDMNVCNSKIATAHEILVIIKFA